jgi:hypothetical protein
LGDEGYLILELPWEGHEPEHQQFEDWLNSACTHPRMEFATEHLANLGGYHYFFKRLAELGWENFPTLKEQLPSANGGLTQAVDSKVALAELEKLELLLTASQEGHDLVLIDAADNHVLHNSLESPGGIFFLGGRSGIDFGVDDGGFFVRRRTDNKSDIEEVFRAMEFDQVPQTGEEVVFRNLQTGVTFRSPVGVTREVPWPDGRIQNDDGRVNQACPKQLKVKRVVRLPDDLEYILRPLRRIFDASVVTGNPVRWC